MSVLRGRTVLVADDEALSQSIVVRMIQSLSPEKVITASDGEEAMRLLNTPGFQCDLIIVDFNMPGAHGLEVLQAIRARKSEVAHDVRIIMLTATSNYKLVGTAFALDVDAFVNKPVAKSVFCARVEKVFTEFREIKSPAKYEKVDIESVAKDLITVKAPAKAAAPDPSPAPSDEGAGFLSVSLEQLPAGSVLAVDIRGPGGELLLAKDTPVSDRLLRRLRELQQFVGIQTVYIYPPTKGKSSS